MSYINQQQLTVLGSQIAPITLTAAFASATDINFSTAKDEQIVIHFFHILGVGETLTNKLFTIQVLTSDFPLVSSSSLWSPKYTESPASGVVSHNVRSDVYTPTIIQGANPNINVYELELPVGCQSMKLRHKESGVVTNFGTFWVTATTSGR